MKREIVRRIAGIFVFLLIFCAGLFGIGVFFSPKNGTIDGFYAEPKNSIDALFVGSSHIMAGISPAQIWQEHQYTSYVMYSWSQPPWTTYHYVKEALKTQKPKVIVVDGYNYTYGNFSFLPENADSVSDGFSLQMPPSFNRIALAAAMSRCQKNAQKLYNYLPVIRFHARWQYLTKEDFTYPFVSHPTTAKGFGPLYEHRAITQLAPPAHLKEGALYPHAEEYLLKLIGLCEKNKIPLMVMTTPYQFMPGEYEAFARIKRICKENNAAYLNYNEPHFLKQSKFDYATDMAENEHINFRGSAKITAHLGTYLATHYQLPGRKYPAQVIKSWQRSVAIEQRDTENMALRLEPDMVRYAKKLVNGKDYIVCIATQGDLATDGKEKAQKFSRILGLDDAIFAQNGTHIAAIVQDGKLVASSNGKKLTHKYKKVSFRVKAAQQGAEIFVNGKNECRNRQGVNVVVYDKRMGKVIHSVSFNAFDNYALMTA